jgi:hypothetical protein
MDSLIFPGSVFGKGVKRAGSGDASDNTPIDRITPEMEKLKWRMSNHEAGGDFAVDQITWTDAVTFCNWLSEQERLQPSYRYDDKDGWIPRLQGNGY